MKTPRLPNRAFLPLLLGLSLALVCAAPVRADEEYGAGKVVAMGDEQYQQHQKFDRKHGSDTGPIELPRPLPVKRPVPHGQNHVAQGAMAPGGTNLLANTGGGLTSTSAAAADRSLKQLIRRLG